MAEAKTRKNTFFAWISIKQMNRDYRLDARLRSQKYIDRAAELAHHARTGQGQRPQLPLSSNVYLTAPLGALNVDFEFVFRDLVTEPKQNRCPTQIPYLFLVCVVAAASWVICSDDVYKYGMYQGMRFARRRDS